MMSRLSVLSAILFVILVPSACSPAEDVSKDDVNPEDAVRQALIARAASLELPGKWEPPPGDHLDHSTAGFAKILCSNVFISGLDPEFAAENLGYFTSPPEDRGLVTDMVVDYEKKAVHLTLPTGVMRSARYYGQQGCIALPIGENSVYFDPVDVISSLPHPDTQPWPMGDLPSDEPIPVEIDAQKISAAVDMAFLPPEAMTALP
jgi:hypothetical protein